MESVRAAINRPDANEYLKLNKIPELFECMMTGVMYHQPVHYINYLQECLEKIKQKGIENVRWDLFIAPKQREVLDAAIQRSISTLSATDPIPGVDSYKLKIKSNASIIFVVSGPGVPTSRYASGLLAQYPIFRHLCTGKLLRDRAIAESTKEDSRWKASVDNINMGNLLSHDFVIETLVWNMNLNVNVDGYIIDGFPKTRRQYEEIRTLLGPNNHFCIILLDASEEFCRKTIGESDTIDDTWTDSTGDAFSKRICEFKQQTLPACKIADCVGVLRTIDAELDPDQVTRNLKTVCEYELSGVITEPLPHPHKMSSMNEQHSQPQSWQKIEAKLDCKSRSGELNIPRVVPEHADNGRASELPTCPIIIIMGGPGSGKSSQVQSLCKKLGGFGRLDMNEFIRTMVLQSVDEDNPKDWDVVARRVGQSSPPSTKDSLIPEYWDIHVDVLVQEFSNRASDNRAMIIEAFPLNENQLNVFNQHIGGSNLVILLDCKEDTLISRLGKRYATLQHHEDEDWLVQQRAYYFKEHTLPIVRYFDEKSLLVTIPCDREEDLILNDLLTTVEYFIAKCEQNRNNSATTGDLNEALLKGQELMKYYLRQPYPELSMFDRDNTELAMLHQFKREPALNKHGDTGFGTAWNFNHVRFIFIFGTVGTLQDIVRCLSGRLYTSTVNMNESKCIEQGDRIGSNTISAFMKFQKLVKAVQYQHQGQTCCIVEGYPIEYEALNKIRENLSESNWLFVRILSPDYKRSFGWSDGFFKHDFQCMDFTVDSSKNQERLIDNIEKSLRDYLSTEHH